MPDKVLVIIERIMKSFFWELVSKVQKDGGLDLGGLKARNLALLAKWGWHVRPNKEYTSQSTSVL